MATRARLTLARLDPEQEARLPAYREKWRKVALDVAPCDRDAADHLVVAVQRIECFTCEQRAGDEFESRQVFSPFPGALHIPLELPGGRPGSTSDSQFLEHILGIVALDQVSFGIGVRKSLAGRVVGDHHVERKPVAEFHLFVEQGYGLGDVQAESVEYLFCLFLVFLLFG